MSILHELPNFIENNVLKTKVKSKKGWLLTTSHIEENKIDLYVLFLLLKNHFENKIKSNRGSLLMVAHVEDEKIYSFTFLIKNAYIQSKLKSNKEWPLIVTHVEHINWNS